MSSGGVDGTGGRGEWTSDGNWTDALEDLVDTGDIDGAITLLESVITRLEIPGHTPSSSSHSTTDDLRLAAALEDLAGLHASRGHSLKSDELRSRSLFVRTRAAFPRSSQTLQQHQQRLVESPHAVRSFEQLEKKAPQKEDDGEGLLSSPQADDEDDWEAIADRSPLEVGVSKVPEVEPVQSRTPTKFSSPKRRGRGSFMYKRDGLYSDELDLDDGNISSSGTKEDSDRQSTEVDDTITKTWKFGTRHVLVLYDFSPKTTTMDLEKLFGRRIISEVAIRWVHDTCALAVFQTPAAASEAQNTVSFPFKVRGLHENDSILNQVPSKDLEPPYPRPKTSARTAQRMIAQVMGLKPSGSSSTSSELKKQEEARKDRIHMRQSLKEDAWGSDDP